MLRRSWRTVLILAAALIVAAAVGIIVAQRTRSPDAPPEPIEFTIDSGIRLSMRLTKALFGRGEPVSAIFTIRNTSAQPVNVGFYASRHFDVYVYDTAGGLVAIWGDGKVIPPGRSLLVLAPGSEHQETLTWDQTRYDVARAAFAPVPAGTYRLRGLLLAQFSTRPSGPEVTTPPVQITLQRPD